MISRRGYAAVMIVIGLAGLGLLLLSRQAKDSKNQPVFPGSLASLPVASDKPPVEFPSGTQVKLIPLKCLKFEAIGPQDKVATDSQGNIHYLKVSNHSIAVYGRNAQLRHQIGHAGQAPGELYYPEDFAIGASGSVYVADTGNRRVQIFNGAGQFVTGFDVGYRPTAITVNSQQEIFINGGHYKEAIIDVYSLNGKLLRSFGEPRRIDFKKLTDEVLPEDYVKRLTGVLSEGVLDVDQSDNVYIAFRSAPMLRKYDRYGKLLFEIETRNARLDQKLPDTIEGLKEKINRRGAGYKWVISALSVDPQTGNIWVSSNLVTQIFVYTNEGDRLAEIELLDAQGKANAPLSFEVQGERVISLSVSPRGVHLFKKPIFDKEQ